MRIVPLLLSALLLSANVALSWSPPPPNDDCTNAIVITPTNGFPFLTEIIYDISGATTNGDPFFECSLARPPTNSVWYAFTPEVTGTYGFSTAEGTATFTNLDTVLGVYEAPAGCSNPQDFVTINCNNDVGEELRAKMFATLTAGNTYLVYVGLFETFTFEGGTNTVQLSVDLWSPPVNDVCANAEVIPSDAQLPYVTAVHDIGGGTTNGSPITVPDCNNAAIRSVWFKYRPPFSSEYHFSTCIELTETVVSDTLLAVYMATNGCDGNLVEVACNDDDDMFICLEEDLQSNVNVDLLADTDYFIVVWQWYDPDFSVIDEVHPGDSSVQLYVNDLNPRIKVDATIQPTVDPGWYHISFAAPSGGNYILEGSQDLINWSVLGTMIYNPGTGRYSFFHNSNSAEFQPYFFYRVNTP